MKSLLSTLLAALVLASPSVPAAEVELKVVKYGGLAEVIKKAKGKIVVVDIWAYW